MIPRSGRLGGIPLDFAHRRGSPEALLPNRKPAEEESQTSRQIGECHPPRDEMIGRILRRLFIARQP